ncbi:tyrosine-type recombinase/integrase [Luteolibacter pohnpeiensis]|uniref:Tyrosine-type recombinase/integrase n=1 Tax=Luteolibacter pohnpeiensis TaxID=454153 RepID=A0A934S821_9BACT|nr:tyrosine-type recombinase/integrase [Luteolibacter pohnpeiensis]MBK1883543.1 tyrosine-type recombinase/integrase [Luteolibacter pohnpeiensis]
MKMRSLYDGVGDRKYTSFAERLAFFEAASTLTNPAHRLFCMVLLNTGCRISEALALKRSHVDRGGRSLVFLTLKQRREIHYRPVPVPDALIESLLALPVTDDSYLFNFGRTTGWKIIKACMRSAGIEGIKATPKGLRHGYAIGCVSIGLIQSKIQELLGHKRSETTSIYTTHITDDIRQQFDKIWITKGI